MDTTDTFHPFAWLAWLAAAALPALSTRNPLYLSLTLLAVAVVYAALGRRSPLAQSWSAFVRFSALLWLLSIPFTALTAHYGTIVLFRLPATWPIVGGPITLEAMLYGLTGGLAWGLARGLAPLRRGGLPAVLAGVDSSRVQSVLVVFLGVFHGWGSSLVGF